MKIQKALKRERKQQRNKKPNWISPKEEGTGTSALIKRKRKDKLKHQEEEKDY